MRKIRKPGIFTGFYECLTPHFRNLAKTRNMKRLFTLLILLFSIMSSAQNLNGKNYTATKIDGTYVVSVSIGANLYETLTDFVRENHIQAGQITGIGALHNATLRFFDKETKQYIDRTFDEFLELTNLSGNIAEIDGKITLHVHVTLGKQDYTVIGGHFLEGVVGGAAEFFIYPLNAKLVKKKDPKSNINLYDF